MAEGLVDAIARGWRDPRAAMAREVGRGLTEARALMHLMLACALLFVASLPNALREARALEIGDPVEGAIAAHLFGYLALAPLLAYALAALVHLAARAFGGRGGFLGARSALFWSMLLVAPVAIGLALLGVAGEVAAGRQLPWLRPLGYAALAFWLWLFAASLAEAEGFAATGRVAAVVVAGIAGLAGVLGVLAGGWA
jgi:Yip1 domain